MYWRYWDSNYHALSDWKSDNDRSLWSPEVTAGAVRLASVTEGIMTAPWWQQLPNKVKTGITIADCWIKKVLRAEWLVGNS